MSEEQPLKGSLAAFLDAAPRPQRTLLRVLLALVARPRGGALLKRLAPLDQLAGGLLTLGRYDAPEVSAALGWDAQAVVSRGLHLRRSEGRP